MTSKTIIAVAAVASLLAIGHLSAGPRSDKDTDRNSRDKSKSRRDPVATLYGAPARSPIGYEGSLLIQLGVSDLDRSIDFYTNVLDFELFLRDDELHWAKLRTGISGVVIGVGEGGKNSGSGDLSLNIGVKNIESARALLESRGVTFSGPTIVIPDVVKLADFTDPDGHRIRLAE